MAQQTSYKGNPMQDYITVAERIEKFYERYGEGRILTHIVEHDAERGFILMRAEGYRNKDDAMPAATGHAFEVRSEGHVNRTSYIENCESSCVGRMLAMMGFEVKRGIASREQMEKQARAIQPPRNVEREKSIALPKPTDTPAPSAKTEKPTPVSKSNTEVLKEEILNLLESLRPGDRRAQRELLVELTGKQTREELTYQEALGLIERLKEKSQQTKIQDDPLM